MRAAVHTRYGPPEFLQITEIEQPVPNEREVLIKVHATTVNRTDCATIRAKPFFMRIITGLFKPVKQISGTEFAGEVIKKGENVSALKVGDKVFGFDDQGSQAHAQFLAIEEDKALAIPGDITYIQAAASSEGAHYALNFINKVDLRKGQRVLVNGATGAIGSAAVQLLKYFGADITAVCATQNIELVKSLGANRVIDYTRENFLKENQKYDFVFDTVGKSSFLKCKNLLLPGGVYISSDLGFLAQNLVLPLITPVIKPAIENKKTVFPNPTDIRRTLLLIKRLMERGKFRAVIDKEYRLEQIVEAFKYVDTGQKIGNVVIVVDHNDDT
ncbi:MAG: NAD(P)-dependent alcohol dehydrogenase [Gammaproteobacteria bacterium]|nr:NAD(P)-dependent alcohol dehydrogenase [Gammaproteobacteria bacterium]